MFDFDRVLYMLPGIIIALTVHEYAHARVADDLGDPTARMQGRLTLNPFAHIDIMGLLILFIAGFGWAKPVPFNPSYFKSPRKDELKVALAGPFTNIFCAVFLVVAMVFLQKCGIINPYSASLNMLITTIRINAGFAIFNLLPLVPLDGSKVFGNILPVRYSQYIDRIAPYSSIILLTLVLLDNYIPILSNLITPVLMLLDKLYAFLYAIF